MVAAKARMGRINFIPGGADRAVNVLYLRNTTLSLKMRFEVAWFVQICHASQNGQRPISNSSCSPERGNRSKMYHYPNTMKAGLTCFVSNCDALLISMCESQAMFEVLFRFRKHL